MSGPDFYAVVSALFAGILLLDVSVLWLTGRNVPDLLGELIFGLFGFYFGRAPGFRRRDAGGTDAPAAEAAGEQAAEAAAQRECAGSPPRVTAPAAARRHGQSG
jgi:hypothetical protein